MQAVRDHDLVLLPEVAEGILAHALATREEEACGLLLWVGGQAVRHWPCHNIAKVGTRHARCHMLVPQLALCEAVLAKAGAQGAMVGTWHSHVWGKAQPSAHDLAGATALDTHAPYVVYATKADAWWLGWLTAGSK